jgi:hypothetical protein
MLRIQTFLASLTLAALLGCGGSSPTTPGAATRLDYTDPRAAPNEWKLVRDASSTDTQLVLNLVGPSDASKYRGVGFTLQVDTAKVRIAKFKDQDGVAQGYYKDGGVFKDVEPGTLAPIPPVLQAGGVRDDKLMVGIFQGTDDSFRDLVGMAGTGATAKDCGATVLQVTLELDPALAAQPTTVPLSMLKARVIPEVVMEGVPDTYVFDTRNRKGADAVIKVGTLALK